uniref:Uncharacterized protein n=1 Tax=Caldisericum exile TaxID=693075 RepID=A0A7C4Y6T6_9BACT
MKICGELLQNEPLYKSLVGKAASLGRIAGKTAGLKFLKSQIVYLESLRNQINSVIRKTGKGDEQEAWSVFQILERKGINYKKKGFVPALLYVLGYATQKEIIEAYQEVKSKVNQLTVRRRCEEIIKSIHPTWEGGYNIRYRNLIRDYVELGKCPC